MVLLTIVRADVESLLPTRPQCKHLEREESTVILILQMRLLKLGEVNNSPNIRPVVSGRNGVYSRRCLTPRPTTSAALLPHSHTRASLLQQLTISFSRNSHALCQDARLKLNCLENTEMFRCRAFPGTAVQRETGPGSFNSRPQLRLPYCRYCWVSCYPLWLFLIQ